MRRVLDETFPILAVIVFVLLVILAVLEPIVPDEEDCRARGMAPDCWRFYETRGRSK